MRLNWEIIKWKLISEESYLASSTIANEYAWPLLPTFWTESHTPFGQRPPVWSRDREILVKLTLGGNFGEAAKEFCDVIRELPSTWKATLVDVYETDASALVLVRMRLEVWYIICASCRARGAAPTLFQRWNLKMKTSYHQSLTEKARRKLHTHFTVFDGSREYNTAYIRQPRTLCIGIHNYEVQYLCGRRIAIKDTIRSSQSLRAWFSQQRAGSDLRLSCEYQIAWEMGGLENPVWPGFSHQTNGWDSIWHQHWYKIVLADAVSRRVKEWQTICEWLFHVFFIAFLSDLPRGLSPKP